MEKTIGDCLAYRVKLSSEEIALGGEMGTYTWREVEVYSDYLAIRMHMMGIKKGDHVGIWSVNTPNWIFTFFALQKIGAITVLINTCYKAEELSKILEYTDVQYVYYGSDYKDGIFRKIIEEILEQTPCHVKKWIPIGKDNSASWMSEGTFVSAEKTLKAKAKLSLLKKEVKPEEVAAILFTSGTNSTPKGVMLTHNNLVNSAYAIATGMRWTKDDRLLLAVSLFHCFGMTACLLASLHTGSRLYILEYYKTIKVLEYIDTYRCTVLSGVPSMFLAMIQNSKFKNYDLSSLRNGIIAGSHISIPDYERVARMLPTLNLLPSYGQTETSPCVSLMPIDATLEEKSKFCGKVIPDVEVRIIDQGHEPGHGEIQVRGYNIMKGYYHLPEETAATLTEEGWLHTGDIGYINEEGYLAITGRKKEMIIRAGENISPREIEDVIRQMPTVKSVKVIGLPAEVVQEQVVACVVATPGKKILDTAVKNYVADRLAHYKVPSIILDFEALPVTSSGKVNIREVRLEAQRKLGESYARA